MTTRRDFLAQSTSCAAHLALTTAIMPSALRRSWARSRGPVVASEAFGNLEKVSDGIWALISTPQSGDRTTYTTLCNGGIIQGKDAILAIEAFYTPEGAAWMANQCKALTGHWPTHVAVTHFHIDHSNGVAAYYDATDNPVLRATQVTRDEVNTKNPADADRQKAMNGAVLLSGTDATTLHLGGKKVRVVPRIGHTDSDISLELDDRNLVFCGDLFWNAVFPNYVNAIPSKLAQSVKALRRDTNTTYIPGHGVIGKQADFDRYAIVIGEVEQAARAAHAKGITADSAAATFTLPDSLATTVSKPGALRAFSAWYKELDQ